MKKIKVIVGSVRDGRRGIKVAYWVMDKASSYKGGLEFSLLDLKEVNLPLLNEPQSPRSSTDYKYEHTKKWSETIKETDGFIFVTPEYNHGYSSAIKNAIDYLYYEWKGKPAGIVGYGSKGAIYSTKQLREVLAMMGVNVLDKKVGINNISEAFDQNDVLKTENIDGDIEEMFGMLETILEDE